MLNNSGKNKKIKLSNGHVIKLPFSLSRELEYSSLTNRLLGDVMRDYIASLKVPSDAVVGGIEVKYTKLLHTMRMRARKLLQFARYLHLPLSKDLSKGHSHELIFL